MQINSSIGWTIFNVFLHIILVLKNIFMLNTVQTLLLTERHDMKDIDSVFINTVHKMLHYLTDYRIRSPGV